MTSGQKIAVTLLSSVLIFAIFTVVAFSGLFTVLETRFYQPAIVRGLEDKLSNVSTVFNNHLEATLTTFNEEFVDNAFVKQSFAGIQTNEIIEGRVNAAGELMLKTPSLLGIRIIESDGRRLHYSTFDEDILQRTATAISYRLYEDLNALAYEMVQSPQVSPPRVIYDVNADLILYSYPFYDDIDAYRGTVVFYTSVFDYTQKLIAENLIRVSETPILVGTMGNPMLLLGLPNTGQEQLIDTIGNSLETIEQGLNRLVTVSDDDSLVLLVDKSVPNIQVAHWYNEQLFVFPDAVKILLLVCIFITSYLVIFLIFNAKQDDMVVIRDRIKRFQFSLINEYLTSKEDIDWNAVTKSISLRKNEVATGIKKSLGSRAKKYDAEVSDILDKSWDEIMAAVGKQSAPAHSQIGSASTDEIKRMLEQILSSGNIVVNAVAAPQDTEKAKMPPRVVKTTPIEEVEELDEVESLEEVEELDEVESLEEVEELDEVESLEEVEELDEVESLEDAEELDEVESLEEVEELDEVESLEDAEELDEVESLEETDVVSSADSEEANLELQETVNDLFKEDLVLGEKVIRTQNSENIENYFDSFDFNISSIDFSHLDEEDASEDGEVDTQKLEIDSADSLEDGSEEQVYTAEKLDTSAFSLVHRFFQAQAPLSDLENVEVDSIVEESGIFMIPKDLEVKNTNVNKDFKTLVDSVLK